MKRVLSVFLCLILIVTMVPVAAEAADIASGSGWRIDADGTLHITGKVTNTSYEHNVSVPWVSYRYRIYKVVAEKGASISNGQYLFFGCKYMTTADLRLLDTSSVTNMRAFFDGCESLTTLYLQGMNTSKVKNFTEFFMNCKSLTSIDLSALNTTSATSYESFFYGCESLKSIDLSRLNTYNATNLSYMFYGCKSLTSLDLRYLDTTNATDLSALFCNCSSLKSIDITPLYLTRVQDISLMFAGCELLTSINLTPLKNAKPTDIGGMFSNCKSLKSIDISPLNTTLVTDMSYLFSRCSSLTSLNLSTLKTANVTRMQSMFDSCSGLTSLDLSAFDTSNTTVMNLMFAGCTSLRTVNVSRFNTSNVTEAYGMFTNCTSLTSLNLSNFDTSAMLRMEDLFDGCRSLKTLDVGNFYVQQLAEGSVDCGIYTFRGCTSLEKITISRSYLNVMARDLAEDVNSVWMNESTHVKYHGEKELKSITGKVTLVACKTVTGNGWNIDADGCLHITGAVNNPSVNGDMTPWCAYKNTITSVEAHSGSSVNNCAQLFMSCPNLTYVDLSKLNTSGATSTAQMFRGCSSLETVILTGLDTSNVTSMYGMFLGCSGLYSLNAESLDTAKVTDMRYMFSDCVNLISVVNLNGFNTTNLVQAQGMFEGCKKLESLDLSSFYTPKLGYASNMFAGCYALTSIDMSNFSGRSDLYAEGIFENCISLSEVKTNGTFISRAADMFFALSSQWTDKSTGVVYSDATSLKKLSGSVTLVKGVYYTCFTISFNMNGHGTPIGRMIVDNGKTLNRPADPVASGWTFVGWYTNSELTREYNFSRPVESSFTLYAKWKEGGAILPATSFYVYFEMNGHGTGIGRRIVKNGQTTTRPSDPTAEGYTFCGWYSDPYFKTPFDFNTPITDNIRLYAKWMVNVPAGKGDLNFDGKINSIDANMMKRINVGKLNPSTKVFNAADINSDSKVNAIDSSRLLMMLVG